MKKEPANRLSAILIILLTALVLSSSFLPIFTVDISSADKYISDYDTEDGFVLQTRSLIIGCEKNVTVSLPKLKPLITDFSRVSVTIQLLFADMQINATEKNLSELEVRLLKNETDSLKKEHAELSEKLAEQMEKRDAIISSMSEEEYKELCLTLADKESELSQFIMMFFAPIVASVLPLANSMEQNDIAAALYAYLVLAFVVIFVVLLIVTLVRAILFAVYTIKGIITLVKGMKDGSTDMVNNLFPRKLKTFVNLTILDALLFSIFGATFSRGMAAFILPISLLLISLACLITQKDRITRTNAVKKIIPIVTAILLLAVILIGFAPLKEFGAFIADKGLENDIDSGFAYMKSLAITLVLKLVIITATFSCFRRMCERIKGDDKQGEKEDKSIVDAVWCCIMAVLAFISMFFLSFEITSLIVFLIASALNIVMIIISGKKCDVKSNVK